MEPEDQEFKASISYKVNLRGFPGLYETMLQNYKKINKVTLNNKIEQIG